MRNAVTLVLVLVGQGALAHGTPPQTLSVSASPFAPGGLVASTTFGLLVTEDRCTWQWVCPDQLELGAREQPVWFVAPSGTLFAGALSGLSVSRDRGCSFTREPFFQEAGPADFAFSDGRLYVATGKFGATNGLAVSEDDGRTFRWTPLREALAFFSAVKVAPSRPQRVYASSWYFEPRRARLSISDDGAQTFTHLDVPQLLAPGSVFTVHGVSATDPELIFASVTDDAVTPVRSTLLRSLDAGRTFSVVLQAEGRVTSLAQDGDHWWVSAGDRVFASPEGLSFSLLPSPKERACVSRVGAQTLVCGRPQTDGYSLAIAGAPVEPLLTWDRISGPIACPAGSPSASRCEARWPVERSELGLPPDHVAACGEPPRPVTKRSGCEAGAGAAHLAVLVFFLRRRRRVESGGR